MDTRTKGKYLINSLLMAKHFKEAEMVATSLKVREVITYTDFEEIKALLNSKAPKIVLEPLSDFVFIWAFELGFENQLSALANRALVKNKTGLVPLIEEILA